MNRVGAQLLPIVGVLAVWLAAPQVLPAQADPLPASRCPQVATRSANEIVARERALVDSAVTTDHGWLELTCIRTEMARRKLVARPGWGMALGDSWRSGALRAAQEAITRGEDDSLPRVLFLRLAMDSSEAPRGVASSLLVEASEMAFDLVSRRAVTDPTALRACTGFALIARDIATARYCGTRALSLGIDSTWHALKLGWIEAGWGSESVAGEFLRMAAHTARGDSGLADLTAAIPGGIRSSRLSRNRWAVDSAYRDSVVARAIGVAPTADADEFDRAAAAQLLSILPSGMGYARCLSMPTLSSCRQSEPIARKLRVTAQVVRGWDVEAGHWVNVVSLAVPLSDLPDTEGSHDLTVRLRAADTAHLHEAEWHASYSGLGATDDGRVMVRSERVAFDEPIQAWTLDVGVDDWSVDGRQHGVLGEVTGDPRLEASSLILGSRQQGLTWVTGRDTIPLLPLGAFTRESGAWLTVQLLNHGAAGEASVRLTLEPFGVGRTKVEPLLTISSLQVLSAGYSVLTRELDFSRLERRLYTMRVAIHAADGAVVRRSTLVDLR